MAIMANIVPDVRAIAVYNLYTSERVKVSNSAGLTLGRQIMGVEVELKLINSRL